MFLNDRPIGVFDSGVGGLTAVREIRKLMPGENIVYFGDTGRVPYGTRSKETILKYSEQAIKFLMKYEVKALIAACGTISTVLDEKKVRELGFGGPYTGIVLPATRTACAMSAGGRIGVIATTAAIRSGAYGKAVRSISTAVKLFGNACPLLVPLVENGLMDKDNPIVRHTLEMYLAPLIREEIDTLILGCTHFPLLYDAVNDVLEYKVTLIDPSVSAVRELQSELCTRDMMNESANGGEMEFYVTDFAEQVAGIAKIFLQEDIGGRIKQIGLESVDI